MIKMSSKNQSPIDLISTESETLYQKQQQKKAENKQITKSSDGP